MRNVFGGVTRGRPETYSIGMGYRLTGTRTPPANRQTRPSKTRNEHGDKATQPHKATECATIGKTARDRQTLTNGTNTAHRGKQSRKNTICTIKRNHNTKSPQQMRKYGQITTAKPSKRFKNGQL